MFRYKFTTNKRKYACYIYTGSRFDFHIGVKDNTQGIISAGYPAGSYTTHAVASSGSADTEWHKVAISITSDNHVRFIFDNEDIDVLIPSINDNGMQKIATFGFDPWVSDYNNIDISDIVFYNSTLPINVMYDILGTF
jgi:hypothetical protein